MAERSPLSEHPFFAPEPQVPNTSTSPSQPRELTIRLNEAMREPPPPPTAKEVGVDVLKSIAAEGAKGIAGGLGGGAGSIETFAVKDVPEMLRGASLWAGEKADIISPAERERMGAEPLPWLRQVEDPNAPPGIRERQELIRRGYASPLSGNLTYKGVTEMFKPLAKAANIPSMAYEPQTGAGKVAGAAAEFGGQNLLGPAAGTLGRVITGAGAGAGGELLALGAEKDAEPVARLTGALTGGVGTAIAAGMAGKLWSGVRGLVAPGSTAERELAAALAEDIRRGQTTMTYGDLAEAYARGAPVSIADMAGPETRKVLGRYAEMAPEGSRISDVVKAFNEALDPTKMRARTDMAGRLTRSLEDVMGGPIDAPALQAATEASGKQIRDNVYTLVHNEPAAAAIDQRPFMHLLNRPVVQDAMKRAERTAQNDPSLNIVVPNVTPASPGTPGQILQTPRGLQNIPGTPATPQQITPGNLSYWDQVQRELRQMKEVALRNGENLDASSIERAREQLLKQLDQIPGYTAARGSAFETFKAAEAPEAGYKFFQNANAFKRHEITDAVRNMTPEQRDLFAVGFAHAVSEQAAKGGLTPLVKKFTQDSDFLKRATLALGPDRVDQMIGHVVSENLLSKAKEIKFIPLAGTIPKAAGWGAVGTAALDAAFLGGQLSQEMAIKAAIGAAATAGGRLALNAVERRVADKILPLATSQDPADIQRIGMMIRQNRAVGTLLNKIGAIVTTAASAPGVAERPQRATGGRIVNLKSLARSAKKAVCNSTEDLLKTPDEHVVKALEIANRSI